MVGIGADVHVEEQTADGRMDISLKLADAIYIFEFSRRQANPERVYLSMKTLVSWLSTLPLHWRAFFLMSRCSQTS